ncbi:TetR/AcrR family transcriptional regulator [Bacillus dakarensis]|uniref:TetR/AcrR family transcriptional regulator n=1 Tax=Robertmurraya dakarensis TaxID=1926278 RepID=UPI000981761B|nr:TetR/AcrR family transcriptional regulator [Bacillus dakarensis]
MKLSEKRLLNKKEQILISAIKIVNQKGFQNTTMEEVAAELLMTKGSLYYYFKNKEDLLFQCHKLVLSRAIEELQAHIDEETTYENRLRKMIKTHIDYAIEEKETFNIIIKPSETFSGTKLEPILEIRRTYAGYFYRVIKDGISAKEFKNDEPKIVSMFLLGSMNWLQQWYNPAGKKSKEEIQDIYAEYILKILK